MSTMPRTETPALITLMEHWAKTIAKNGGVAAVTIQEGADRLRELETEVEKLKKDQIECGNWIGNKMLQPEWDSFKKSLEVIDHWKARAERADAELATERARMDWLESDNGVDWQSQLLIVSRDAIDKAMKEASK